MSEQLILIREQFRWGLANLTQASLNLDNEDIDYLIQQAERVEELEENCSHLRKSFQRQKNKAVEGWEKVIELEKENQDHLFTISDLEFQISRLRLQTRR